MLTKAAFIYLNVLINWNFLTEFRVEKNLNFCQKNRTDPKLFNGN